MFKDVSNLDETHTIYEKVMDDLINMNKKMQIWWNEMSVKYQWKSDENGSWRINFDTNEIYLQTVLLSE